MKRIGKTKELKFSQEKEKNRKVGIVDGKSLFFVYKNKREIKPITCKCEPPMFCCSGLLESERKCLFTKLLCMNWND